MTHERHCAVCGRVYHTTRYKNRYCSRNCQIKAKNHKYEVPEDPMENGEPYLATLIYKKVCPVCGKNYTAKRSNQKYCSHHCSKLYRKNVIGKGNSVTLKVNDSKPVFNLDTGKIIYQKLCLNCGKEFKAQHITSKFCCQGCARKYSVHKSHQEKLSVSELMMTYEGATKDIKRYSDKEYLRISEASAFLGVSEKTIRRYVSSKELPSIRTRRIILVPTHSLVTMYINHVNASKKVCKEEERSKKIKAYLSITEASKEFDIKRTTIAHYFTKRKLHFIKIGHIRHYKYSDIEALIKDFRPNQHKSIRYWYTVVEIMSIYSMDRKQVYWFTQNHKIPHKKSGKIALYSKIHVDKIKVPSLFDKTQYCEPCELCKMYGLSKDRLYHIIKVMSIPTIRFGREVWILRSAFEGIIC